MRLDRGQLPRMGSLALSAAIAGCITVHVYFPVRELREAADEIVEEVRPDIVSTDGPAPEGGRGTPPGDSTHEEQAEPDADGPGAHVEVPPARPALLAAALISPAWAAEEDSEGKKGGADEADAVINTSSPRIEKIKASLKARFAKLLPLYAAGRIGESLEGFLAVRDVKDLDLKARRDVGLLVKAENADRQSLYTTIARESEIPDGKIKDIGRLFSRSWQKQSKPGWWIEVEVRSGTETKRTWVRKPKEPEKSEKSGSSGSSKPKGAA